MTAAATYQPTDQEVVEACRPAFADRDAILAAGYIPGWHGAPAVPGERCVVYGHGGWRQAIVTKVTAGKVHALFTTPGAIDAATKIQNGRLSASDGQAYTDAARAARRNWAWNNHLATHEVGTPADPNRRDSWTWFLITDDLHDRGVAFLATSPDQELHAREAGLKAADEVRASRAKAVAGSFLDYLNLTKGSGDRTGARTNLYVLPREA